MRQVIKVHLPDLMMVTELKPLISQPVKTNVKVTLVEQHSVQAPIVTMRCMTTTLTSVNLMGINKSHLPVRPIT